MTNDVTTTDSGPVSNPFGGDRSQAVTISASAAAMEQRAVAEVQASYIMAQKFPRDERAAVDRIIDAFGRSRLADAATYEYPRGGETVTGPSIRAAEAIAQQWGNIDTGFSEIGRYRDDRGVGVSIVRAQAVDLQNRTRKYVDFHVRHWRDTKSGGYPLSDERDVYELIANQSQRRVRACILALIPSDVVETALAQAERTVKASTVVNDETRGSLLAAFAPYGITKEHIEKRLQRRFDTLTPGNMIGLRRIFSSLRDGISKPGDWFDALAERPETAAAVAALNAKVAAPPPAPEPPAAPPPAPEPPAAPPAAPEQPTEPPAAPEAPAAPLTLQPAIWKAEEVLRRLDAAQTTDALDEAADLIKSVEDAAQRVGLTAHYRSRRQELSGE